MTCESVRCIGADQVKDDDIVIEQETGGAWTTIATVAGPSPGWRFSVFLSDIACASSAHCIVVGRITQNVGTKMTLIAEGTGAQWAIVSSPNVSGDLASPAPSS
jgi:hypothetical protein